MLDPEDYVIQRLMSDGKTIKCALAFLHATDLPTGSHLSLANSFYLENTVVLGQTFLNKYYSALDRDKFRVGLA